MLLKVTQDQDKNVREAKFTFEVGETIPTELLKFIDEDAYREKMKEHHIGMLKMIIKSIREDMAEDTFPNPDKIEKLNMLKGILHRLENDGCLCGNCANDKSNADDQLNAILKANGINPN